MSGFARPLGPRSRGAVRIGWPLLALVLSASLLAVRLAQPFPPAGTAVVLAVALLSAFSPASALLVFAGLSPLTTGLAGLLGAAGTPFLERLALAAALGPLLRRLRSDSATRLGGAAALMAVVALTSAISLVPAKMAVVAEAHEIGGRLARAFLAGSIDDPIWPALTAGLFGLEYALLAVAVEREARTVPTLAPRLLAMVLVGHAGAAALNVARIAGAALRTGDFWHALPLRLLDTRTSQQTDVNAAASALVLAAVAGLALVRGSWRQRIGVLALVLVTAAGIWVTGSRAAILAGIFVPLLFWVSRLVQQSRRPRLAFAGAIAALATLGALALAAYPAGRNDTIRGTFRSRLVLTELGWRMFESAPAFGIGLTEFYDQSAILGGPGLATQVGAPRENAHNNFVQVLAEEGLAGLTALIVLLAVVLTGGPREAPPRAASERFWLLAGVSACVATWLTGHPLLVPEFGFVFWFCCGLAAATGRPLSWRWNRWLAWSAVALLLTIPPRSTAARDRVELEHLGRGLSTWERDDSQRYRTARGEFVLFLPGAGAPVRVPVRRAPGAPDPLTLRWSSPTGPPGAQTLTGDEWQTLAMQLQAGARRFVEVRFEVAPDTSTPHQPSVRVGRDFVAR